MYNMHLQTQGYILGLVSIFTLIHTISKISELTVLEKISEKCLAL